MQCFQNVQNLSSHGDVTKDCISWLLQNAQIIGNKICTDLISKSRQLKPFHKTHQCHEELRVKQTYTGICIVPITRATKQTYPIKQENKDYPENT